mmetsp:Transcript_63747/g.152467  ORF Transcript_63747/g.152467 Transcript_63747/m.152467 type:complete len:303 (-) Transcript_63747:67-975(-)
MRISRDFRSFGFNSRGSGNTGSVKVSKEGPLLRKLPDRDVKCRSRLADVVDHRTLLPHERPHLRLGQQHLEVVLRRPWRGRRKRERMRIFVAALRRRLDLPVLRLGAHVRRAVRTPRRSEGEARVLAQHELHHGSVAERDPARLSWAEHLELLRGPTVRPARRAHTAGLTTCGPEVVGLELVRPRVRVPLDAQEEVLPRGLEAWDCEPRELELALLHTALLASVDRDRGGDAVGGVRAHAQSAPSYQEVGRPEVVVVDHEREVGAEVLPLELQAQHTDLHARWPLCELRTALLLLGVLLADR